MRRATLAGLGVSIILAAGGCAAEQYFRDQKNAVLTRHSIPQLERDVAMHTPAEDVLLPASLPHTGMRVDPQLLQLHQDLRVAKRTVRNDPLYITANQNSAYAHGAKVAGVGAAILFGFGCCYRRR